MDGQQAEQFAEMCELAGPRRRGFNHDTARGGLLAVLATANT
jgi:hypothetical protein